MGWTWQGCLSPTTGETAPRQRSFAERQKRIWIDGQDSYLDQAVRRHERGWRKGKSLEANRKAALRIPRSDFSFQRFSLSAFAF
jgi:hypothetical protein